MKKFGRMREIERNREKKKKIEEIEVVETKRIRNLKNNGRRKILSLRAETCKNMRYVQGQRERRYNLGLAPASSELEIGRMSLGWI